MSSCQNKSVNNTQRYFDERIWIANVVVITFLVVVSGYLIASLIFFELKRRNKEIPGNKEARFTSRAKKIGIAIAIISLFHNLASLWTLTIERFVSDQRAIDASRLELSCQILPRFETCAIYVGTGLVYLFLWCRQRVFYINPSLKELNNNKVKIVSYFVFGLWVCYYVPTAIVYWVVVRYELLLPGGCFVVRSSLLFYRDIIISWVSVSIFMQITLLGLFVNPIINRTLIHRQSSSKFSPKRSCFSNKLLQRVKRAFLLTVICLASDILSATVTVFTYRADSNNLTLTYNANLVINLLAVVSCFDNWTTLFWPWTEDKKKSNLANKSSIEATDNQLSNRRNISSMVVEETSK